MFKAAGLLLLVHAVASAAYKGPPVSMPEPSALPELFICLAAVGCLAWHQHVRSNRRIVSDADRS